MKTAEHRGLDGKSHRADQSVLVDEVAQSNCGLIRNGVYCFAALHYIEYYLGSTGIARSECGKQRTE